MSIIMSKYVIKCLQRIIWLRECEKKKRKKKKNLKKTHQTGRGTHFIEWPIYRNEKQLLRGWEKRGGRERGKRRERGDVYATLCPVFIVRCLSLTFAVAPGWSCHFLYKDSTFFLPPWEKKHLIMSSGRKLKHFERFYADAKSFDRQQSAKIRADTVGGLNERNGK